MRPVYGLTHDVDGTPRVIEPKTTKVGIGLAKGKALHVYLDQAGKWVVYVAKEPRRFDTKAEAKKFYREAKVNAPERAYPQRLPYFTFNRVSPDGLFEPDWDVVESHGPLPTEIDIIFTRDEPFAASYQMWGSTERKCDGDGINAMRVLSLASTADEKALAAQAERNGEKYFPIVSGCYTRGCPYAKAQGDKPPVCRPHGRLLFQLLNAPRLGGTAYFDTTGWRSISQLFSCISTFKAVTGQGDAERGFVAGIPLKMVLRPYRTQHNGKATTQYGVSLEFRAESAYDLKRQLVEHGVNFRLSDSAALGKLLPAPEPQPLAPDDDDVPDDAAAIVAEFQGGDQPADREDFGDPEAPAALAMPQRKSETAAQPEPDPQPLEVAPELDQCWDPPEPEAAAAPAAPAKPVPQGAPPPANAYNGRLALDQKRKQVYEAARKRGATDAVIAQQLGNMGYEKIEEAPEPAISKLLTWARAYKHQPALI